MNRHHIGMLALAVALAVLGWTVPAGARTASTHVTSVTVTAGKPSEFRFTLTKKSAPLGVVSFHVVNKGTVTHDFEIDGHTTKMLSPGQSQTLKLTFTKAKSYTYLCTVPGHAAAGMKGVFEIT